MRFPKPVVTYMRRSLMFSVVMTVESRVRSKAAFCFKNLYLLHLAVTMEAVRPKTCGTVAGFRA